jgi:hypothetical protein
MFIYRNTLLVQFLHKDFTGIRFLMLTEQKELNMNVLLKNTTVAVHVARHLHLHIRAQYIFFRCKKNIRLRSQISSMFG